MTTLDIIFERLGGYGAVAKALDVPAGTASAWKTRGSIPAQYWQPLLHSEHARDRGLTADDLIDAHSRKGPPLAHVHEEGAKQ